MQIFKNKNKDSIKMFIKWKFFNSIITWLIWVQVAAKKKKKEDSFSSDVITFFEGEFCVAATYFHCYHPTIEFFMVFK